MFIAKWEENGKEEFYIYNKNRYGYKAYFEDTFSPLIEKLETLDLSVKGKSYREKQTYLRELAIDYQLRFAPLSWSYGELIDIQDFFDKNAKRYGLYKEFKENCVC